MAKYKLIIDDFGEWGLFQQLLATLSEMGRRHGASIATAAGRHILQKSGVGTVIIGARLARHLPEKIERFSRIDSVGSGG